MTKRHPKDCPHLWESPDPESDPVFVANRQMWKGLKAPFTCARCNARTWLSEEEWENLEEAGDYAY